MVVRRPTIAEVAAHAGVSQSAVSFALNGRPGVSDETRQRILGAARDLGWQPSHRARALSTSRAFALGLVLARPPELFSADPFFPAFVGGVETVLAPAGQSLLLQVVPDAAAEADAYRRLAGEGRVDGVFLSDLRHGDTRITLLAELGLPTVTLNRPDVPSPFPAVCLDDRPGITAAVTHLIALGHRRIAHVAGPPEFLHASNRRDAWAAALAGAGLSADLLVNSDFTAAGGAVATRELLTLAEPPTAIVYGNDPMAVAGLAVAAQLGLSVPGDVSMTGFDNTDITAYVHPTLTTVDTDVFHWGSEAARTLLELAGGAKVTDTQLPDAELVIRASTAPAPTGPHNGVTAR